MPEDENSFKGWLAENDASRQYHAERIQAELDVAESMCRLRKTRATEWKRLIARAADAAVRAGAAGTLETAVRDVEKILAPIGKVAKEFTVYLVGHAHIDMNWMWSWPETVAVTNDTFGTVLRLMDEFPEFHFSQSQASVYAIMEEHNPEMLKRIAKRVKEGRWEVTASHWVEGDKNLAGGESLCRHLLYTRRYMQDIFSLSPEDVPIDWSPDTFGHAVTVPTYLVRGGVKYLYLHRPGIWVKNKPAAFWWKGPDGSRVLVKNDMALGYNGVITPAIAKHLATFSAETGLQFSVFVFGVGDHGGGPTRRDIVRALDMNTWPVFPNVRMSTAKAFFERLEKEGKKLPVLDCELNTEFTGCYTSQSLIKKANRYNEKNLVNTETASTMAWATLGRTYPADGFVTGWRDTLFSHFHDILPGSGVHDTRTYTHGLYQKTAAFTGAEETNALRFIASKIDTSSAGVDKRKELPPSDLSRALGAGVGLESVDGGISRAEQNIGGEKRPVIVFNLTGRKREEIVEATVWDSDKDRFSVTAPGGETVEAQVLGTKNYWGHSFVRLAFPVNVAGYGYGLYVIEEGCTVETKPGVNHLGAIHHCAYATHEKSGEGLENDLVRLEINTRTGGIASLTHKKSKTKIIGNDNSVPVLEYLVEKPHGMTAWQMDHTGPMEIPAVKAIDRKHNGPHKCSIEVLLSIHESELTLVYELRSGDPNVYMHIEGTWFERGTPEKGVPVLRASFPFALAGIKARYEIPFGSIDRDLPNGAEVPALNWARITGGKGKKKAGCLLLNDSKHGYSLDGKTLRLTLIRSSYDPDPLPEIGRHEIHLALTPFAGDMPIADAVKKGLEFTNALRVVSTDAHRGPLPASAGLIDVATESVVVSAVKKGEEDALILRFFDPTGRKAVAKAKLNPDFFGRVTGVSEVDLLERPIPRSTAVVQGNTVSVDVPSRGISTIKVKLKRKQGR